MAKPIFEEIKEVAFAICPDSAPGQDGLTTFFYQHYWDIVKVDAYNSVISFFKGGPIPSFLDNYISMIPKTNNATRLGDFRPISL